MTRKLFALSDPHLSFGNPSKTMNKFGSQWINHSEKIKENWLATIKENDIVAIPGDISWGCSFEEAIPDLIFLNDLPGVKVLLPGNHDTWWPSLKKLNNLNLTKMHYITKNSVPLDPYIFFGARLWDTCEYHYYEKVDWQIKCYLPASGEAKERQENIYNRELNNLKTSAIELKKYPSYTPIGLTHYPPLGLTLQPSKASNFFNSTKTQHVIFGHLHNMIPEKYFGKSKNVTYHLTSCDYINFTPLLICEK